jgi:4-hydroxybenzoate polyprenyltransferase
MALNDFCDRSMDAVERPNRPLPSGLISPGKALGMGVIFLIAGLGLTLVYSSRFVFIFSTALVISVAIYNFLHQVFFIALATMAVCRGLLLIVSGSVIASAVGEPGWWRHIFLPAVVVAAYTMAISIIARREAETCENWRLRLVGWLIVGFPLIHALFLLELDAYDAAFFCAFCCVLTWLGQRWLPGT